MDTIDVMESLPAFVSMRKSALVLNGGTLNSLYDVPRWDGAGESRARGVYMTHKDDPRHYRNQIMRSQIRAMLGKV